MDQGCICQRCMSRFTVDLMVPDDLWEVIKPQGKPLKSGLLCSQCIIERVITHLEGEFAAFKLEVM